eukprot:5598353-Amphidinium_carterae.1
MQLHQVKTPTKLKTTSTTFREEFGIDQLHLHEGVACARSSHVCSHLCWRGTFKIQLCSLGCFSWVSLLPVAWNLGMLLYAPSSHDSSVKLRLMQAQHALVYRIA